MHALIYFDTEDYFSAPDHPVHQLPGQFAEIMTRHGLPGCFHIHGEKARFMQRHGQTQVIEAIRKHDVSLHYDRGSIPPTTASEVSRLGWFEGVERTLFRELPGIQALERIFGKCSGLTQHGGTFAAPIIYAMGKLGKPFLYSPFRLSGNNVVWYANNLLIGGYQADFYFDVFYRDTPKFEEQLAKVDGYLTERAKNFDFTAMFGCHPLITVMQDFPDGINFANGAAPPPEEWQPPVMIEGVSIETVLANFERLVTKLVAHPDVEWTDVAGMHQLYGSRPVRVSDEVVVAGAKAVRDNGGPTFTDELSAGELLFLLARRTLKQRTSYEVPQVMGPLQDAPDAPAHEAWDAPAEQIASEIVRACQTSGYLPDTLGEACGGIWPEQAILILACHALGEELPARRDRRPFVRAIPGVDEALENVRKYVKWRCHRGWFYEPGIIGPFVRQCWTLKPAMVAEGYGEGVELGRYVNPMFDGPVV